MIVDDLKAVIEVLESCAEHAEVMQGIDDNLPRQETLIAAMGFLARSLREAEFRARQALAKAAA